MGEIGILARKASGDTYSDDAKVVINRGVKILETEGTFSLFYRILLQDLDLMLFISSSYLVYYV